jgi:signal transduction histidine kinase
MKLAAALAVPLLALVLVTVVEVVKSSDEVRDTKAQTGLARITVGPTGLITALQNERIWAVVELIGYQDDVSVPVEGYERTRAETDEAVDRFRAEVGDVGGAATRAYAPALDGLDALQQLRDEIDTSENARRIENVPFANDMFSRYADLIMPFLDSGSQVAMSIDDPDLRLGVELVDTTSRQIEVLADLVRSALVTAVSTGGLNEPHEVTHLGMLQATFNRNASLIEASGGRYASIVADHFPAELNDGLNAQLDAAISTGRVDVAGLLGAINVPDDLSYPGLQRLVSAALFDRADEINGSANARDNWFIALAVVTLGLALVLTWWVSRSITQPLRALTQQAKEMAEQRLPDAVLDILETPMGDDVQVPQVEPVEVHTHDEVADVAVALNTVQDTALDLAVEQAVLRRNIADSFVNLGRRNQNLLGRQLDFITELESHETDPDTLASLFRLDHLATRMRRNAESLLVLAGIDPPRKWAAPVRLTDVIRAALGEVEDYQRVTIRDVEPATVLGSAAADLAHLIAEFIENALTFSPPDENVEIRGRARGEGYSLAIIDVGLGMAETDIAQANRRLAGTESFTIAPSKYLGHYVAGNLAARHGIHLELQKGSPGVTANIEIPSALLTADTPTDDPITDPHGHRPVPGHVPLADDLPQPALAAAPNGGPGSAGDESGLVGAAAGPAVPGGPGGPNGIADALANLAESVASGRTDTWAAPATPTPTPTPAPAPAARAPGHGANGGHHGHGGQGGHGGQTSGVGWVQTGPVRRAAPGPEATRTASGLVKRTPVGPAPAAPAAPAGPSDDLLAALGHHAKLGRDAANAPAPATPGPAPAPAVSPGTAPSAHAAPTPTPTPTPAPASAPAPTPGPGPAPEASPGTISLDAVPASAPEAPGGRRRLARRGSRAEAGDPPATTSSGLARRVRGKHMPDTDPLTVRRRDRGDEPASEPPAQHSPDDVYGFLTNFTSGVQRGLDDAHAPGRDDG